MLLHCSFTNRYVSQNGIVLLKWFLSSFIVTTAWMYTTVATQFHSFKLGFS